MLRITQSQGGGQAAAAYYTVELASGERPTDQKSGDYYVGPAAQMPWQGQAQWRGQAAPKLGLAPGTLVASEAFAALANNQHPGTGQQLTLRLKRDRRAGYDITFDVPKSVSLAACLANDEAIFAVVQASAWETMAEMEAQVQTRVRRQGRNEARTTGNWVFSDHLHLDTRPVPLTAEKAQQVLARWPALQTLAKPKKGLALPEPQVHIHCFVQNATFDPVEKQWKALDIAGIKEQSPYYQAVYHAHLAAGLRALGYTIEHDGKSSFRLCEVPPELDQAFSNRTQEIERAARLRGITAPSEKAKLGQQTRRHKRMLPANIPLPQLWQSMAPPDPLDRLQQAVEKVQDQRLAKPNAGAQLPLKAWAWVGRLFGSEPPTQAEASRHAVDYALQHFSERQATMSREAILAEALQKFVGEVTPASVKAAFEARRDIVVGNNGLVTTTAIVKEEQALIELVAAWRGQGQPVAVPPTLATAKRLSPEQGAALHHVLQHPDGVVGLIGKAGTGKTTLLRAVEIACLKAGTPLRVCSPTTSAREVLAEGGIAEPLTVDTLLLRPDRPALLQNAVLWVDEAALAGQEKLLELLQAAREEGAKRVVLAGDYGQNRSVARGESLRLLVTKAALPIATLRQIFRQEEPLLKHVVELCAAQQSAAGLAQLGRAGHLIECSAEEAIPQLAGQYVHLTGKAGMRANVLVVCPTHAEGDRLTTAIRDQLRLAKRLGEKQVPTSEVKADVDVQRLRDTQWTQAQRRLATSYKVGQVVQFHQNVAGFTRGERVRVVGLQDNQVRVRTNNDKVEDLPRNAAKHFSVFHCDTIPVAPGELLRITQNGSEQGWRYYNGAIVRVKAVTQEGVTLSNGRRLPTDFGAWTYAYVVTAERSQSQTVDHVLSFIGPRSLRAMNQNRSYVTISRARKSVTVYTTDRAQLLRAAQNLAERPFAIEVAEQAQRRALALAAQTAANRQRERMRFAQRVAAWWMHRSSAPSPAEAPAVAAPITARDIAAASPSRPGPTAAPAANSEAPERKTGDEVRQTAPPRTVPPAARATKGSHTRPGAPALKTAARIAETQQRQRLFIAQRVVAWHQQNDAAPTAKATPKTPAAAVPAASAPVSAETPAPAATPELEPTPSKLVGAKGEGSRGRSRSPSLKIAARIAEAQQRQRLFFAQRVVAWHQLNDAAPTAEALPDSSAPVSAEVPVATTTPELEPTRSKPAGAKGMGSRGRPRSPSLKIAARTAETQQRQRLFFAKRVVAWHQQNDAPPMAIATPDASAATSAEVPAPEATPKLEPPRFQPTGAKGEGSRGRPRSPSLKIAVRTAETQQRQRLFFAQRVRAWHQQNDAAPTAEATTETPAADLHATGTSPAAPLPEPRPVRRLRQPRAPQAEPPAAFAPSASPSGAAAAAEEAAAQQARIAQFLHEQNRRRRARARAKAEAERRALEEEAAEIARLREAEADAARRLAEATGQAPTPPPGPDASNNPAASANEAPSTPPSTAANVVASARPRR